jgi:RNA-directed DNA polymerase
MPEDSSVNIGDLLTTPFAAGRRVLEIQTKLHRWAVVDADRQFKDLFNLVADPAFLVTAWERVRWNTGARSAGIDKRTARSVEASMQGVEGFLTQLRSQLKDRSFCPVPVREKKIPKAGGKVRRLGIPTVRDRVVQASLKLVLEPILEADFLPDSYGFRPNRRAQDAIEAIRKDASDGYEWIFEGDIAACFDEISHAALMDRLRKRVGDRRVLALVKAFLKAGLLTEEGHHRDTYTGTPQGGILSPLLANLALSILDEHFAKRWQAHTNSTARMRHRQRGGATYRLTRYADDFVVMVNGGRHHAEELWNEVQGVLDTMGLRLAPDKTQVVHIDEGFDFLGFRIRRHRQKGSDRRLIYTYPASKAITTIRRKVKTATTNSTTTMTADALFRRLGQITRGWAIYFRHGSSSTAYSNLQHYLFWRVWSWLRHKHPKQPAKWIRRRYFPGNRWWPTSDEVDLFQPTTINIVRYRYRGSKIPTPWTQQPATN